MKSRIVPIVFAFDARVLRPAAVAIMSLIDAALEDTVYDIHILHPGFSQKLIRGYSSITKDTRHTICFHAIKKRQLAGLPSGRGSWTEIVYYRFLIPEVLRDYNRAIYSDIDVYFTGDLSCLMDLDMKSSPIGAVVGEINSPKMKCHTYFPENSSEYIYMSGFLLMDLNKMREGKIGDNLFKTARKYGSRLNMFDLDALNLTCKNIFPLSFEYCVLETVFEAQSVQDSPEFSWLSGYYSVESLNNAKANAKIIHYAGPLGKPWRRAVQPSYYRLALQRVPSTLNRRTIRDVRKRWSSQLIFMLRRLLRRS